MHKHCFMIVVADHNFEKLLLATNHCSNKTMVPTAAMNRPCTAKHIVHSSSQQREATLHGL